MTADGAALVRRFIDEVFVQGKTTGDFMGVPAAGKRYTIGEMHWFRIAGGRIAEHWHQHDALGLMRQLGALPGP